MFPVDGAAHRGVADVRHLFVGEHLSLVAEAVATGNSPGILWADDPGQARSALLWDGGHSVYLVGPADPAGTRAWTSMFDDLLVPAARARHITVLKVYPGSSAALGAAAATASHRTVARERVFLRGPSTPPPAAASASAWRLSEINQHAETLAGLAGFPAVLAEIESCWTSPTQFRRSGFGYCAHDTRSVLGWCTAEYVSAGRCGIGIETVEAFQGRGIAAAMATAFVAESAARDLTPHWDAWADNSASLRVAAKVCFTPVERYPILVATLA